MSFISTISQRIKSAYRSLRGSANDAGTLAIQIGQQSRPANSLTGFSPVGIIARRYRQYADKDLTEIRGWDHENILKVIRTISPEASSAVTMFLRTFDSGYTIAVKKKNGELNQNAKALLTQSLSRMQKPDPDRFSLPRDINSLSLKLALDVLFKGAISGELIFNKTFKPENIVYVDPWSLTFKELEGSRYVPYQYQDGKEILFDKPNFIYIPVDPMGDDPYGEEQIASAVQPILFKAMLMQDLQRVVHVQGWQRMTFKVVEEAVLKNLPPTAKSPAQKRAFVADVMAKLKTDYENIEPDANIVHSDAMEVGKLEAGGGVMLNPEALLNVVDNQIANGLKTFSVLLSKKFGGGSEGFTSAETVLYIKLIAGYQNFVERFWGRIGSLVLKHEHGIIADVSFKFKKPELRTEAEMAQWTRIRMECVTTAFNEQTIGVKEKAQLFRETLGLEGNPPNDIAEERILNNKEPDEPERGSESEEDKEGKRKERNRSRRRGEKE